MGESKRVKTAIWGLFHSRTMEQGDRTIKEDPWSGRSTRFPLAQPPSLPRRTLSTRLPLPSHFETSNPRCRLRTAWGTTPASAIGDGDCSILVAVIGQSSHVRGRALFAFARMFAPHMYEDVCSSCVRMFAPRRLLPSAKTFAPHICEDIFSSST
ncbi:hypothetical protein BDZ97DRAFT_2060637 [Flammula alnicola]|nr:hypothetical protein BDZ97DRAFT_2060637 [Flammula alnicola]